MKELIRAFKNELKEEGNHKTFLNTLISSNNYFETYDKSCGCRTFVGFYKVPSCDNKATFSNLSMRGDNVYYEYDLIGGTMQLVIDKNYFMRLIAVYQNA